MDQGLFKTHHGEVKEHMEDLIQNDDKNGFVSFIRSHLGNDNSGTIESMLLSGDIIMWICSHGAKGCDTALLEGETGLAVDLNVPLKNECYPLHYAAENLSSCLTDLFLRHAARTDLPCADVSSEYHGMLPLSVALEALRRHQYLTDWNPKKSIFKLIFVLCLPELQEPLQAIKLLSEKTQELEQISSSVAQQGKLVELAGLLFVAWNKLLVPASGEGVDSSLLRKCILESLTSLIDQEYRLMDTGRSVELNDCRKMEDVMLSASLMFTVFERGGEVIDIYRLLCPKRRSGPNYIWVRSTIIILKQLGFALKREDTNLADMRCFRVGIEPEKAEALRCAIDQMLHSKSKFSGQTQISASLDGRRNQKELFLNDPAVGGLVQPPSSSIKLFHTCQFPVSRSGPKLCTPAEAHLMNISKQAMVFSVMRGACCALTFTRGMRRAKLI